MDTKLSDNLENTAKILHKGIREKAGLKLDWETTSEEMKNFCRELARRLQHGEANHI